MSEIEVILGGVLSVAVVGVYAAEAISERLKPSPTEREQQRYADGEISLEELERRLAVLEDPEARRIREATETVSGIGEGTSWSIAARFDTEEQLSEASLEELEEIPNVGEQRARAIREEIGGRSP